MHPHLQMTTAVAQITVALCAAEMGEEPNTTTGAFDHAAKLDSNSPALLCSPVYGETTRGPL